MITILFHMTVKEERDDAWRELVPQLTQSTRAEDAGCLNYTYHRQLDNPREYVLYEQWQDEDALTRHLARLAQVLGPPPPGGRLPARYLDHLERTQVVRYEVLD
jgi:quinol monooxygenase YgiN